ncbi:MAG TPA: 2-dehydropantoate 2-reductase [Burkholderiaceae bacterium]|nr:2-dehydropantoate 2-reductase [Burkholderiaceae bacterium]
MKVAIVGAGSIGGVVGARLAASGHDVILVARGAHLETIRRAGLRLVDHVGVASGTYHLPASDDPAEFGRQDLVVIGLKAHAIPAMLPRLAALVGPETTVVPGINGLPWWYFHAEGSALSGRSLRALDPDGTMFDALDPARILGCVVHFAAEVRAPGEVHHTGGRRLILGEPDRTLSSRLSSIGEALDDAGFETERSRDIRLDVWIKLLGNLSFNPIAALTGYLMNQIIADADVLDVIRAMMREGMAVSRHYGYVMPLTPDQRIDIARQLGAAKISMLQDLEQRRPLELAAIVGAVIELAGMADIPVPTIRHVHALTLARARALGIA